MKLKNLTSLAILYGIAQAYPDGDYKCYGGKVDSTRSLEYLLQGVTGLFDNALLYNNTYARFYNNHNAAMIVEVKCDPLGTGSQVKQIVRHLADCQTYAGIYTGTQCKVAYAASGTKDQDMISPKGQCCVGGLSNADILNTLNSLNADLRRLQDSVDDWYNAVQANSSSSNQRRSLDMFESSLSFAKRQSSSGIEMFAMNAMNQVNRFNTRVETALEQDQAAANAGNDFARQQLPNFRDLITRAGDLRDRIRNAAGAGSTLAAVGLVLAGLSGFDDLFFSVLLAFRNDNSSHPPPTTTKSTSTTTSATPTATICSICKELDAATRQLVSNNPGVLTKRDQWIPASSKFDARELVARNSGSRAISTQFVNSYGTAYGNGQPRINFCPDGTAFIFRTQRYPSTSGNSGNPPNGANDENSNEGLLDIVQDNSNAPTIQGIGKLNGQPYIDIEYSEAEDNDSGNLATCGIRGVRGYANRNGDSSLVPAPNGGYNYNTEHVFENHMVKDFFYWLTTNNQPISCQALRANFMNGDVAYANEMMKQLAWYDPSTPSQGFIGELYVLNQDLNFLKGAIMNGRPLSENESQNHVLPRNFRTFNDCLVRLDHVTAVFDYLGKTSRAFTNARDRVHTYLGSNQVHTDIAFAPLWYQWINQWLNKRQSDVLAWRTEILNTCRPLAITANSCFDEEGYDTEMASQYPAANFMFPGTYFVQQ